MKSEKSAAPIVPPASMPALSEEQWALVLRAWDTRLAFLGLTSADLGRELGISRQAITQRIARRNGPVLEWMASVLGVPGELLATGDAAACVAAPAPPSDWLAKIRSQRS